MKIDQLLESNYSLRNVLVDILTTACENLKADLSDREDSHVPLNNTLSQVQSGKIQLERGYVSHSQYGGSVVFDLALKIGTGVDGPESALDMANDCFKSVKEQAVQNEFDVSHNPRDDYMIITNGSEKALVACRYGSAFSWVAFRMIK